jgi:ATPase subunit of ABC transporter with duplicated ATPase domains
MDMESIESLNLALDLFKGTLIFVSHDRQFVPAWRRASSRSRRKASSSTSAPTTSTCTRRAWSKPFFIREVREEMGRKPQAL